MRNVTKLMALGLVSTLAGLTAPSAMADPVAGKKAFGACAACHGTTPGAKKLGPTLFEVVGREAGKVPGFKYSPAMKASGKTWNRRELDAYIANPRKAVPGTRMPYGGMRNAKMRSDLVDYLLTLD